MYSEDALCVTIALLKNEDVAISRCSVSSRGEGWVGELACSQQASRQLLFYTRLRANYQQDSDGAARGGKRKKK
jgi:hypothetical protein